MAFAIPNPRKMPITPPVRRIGTASMRNWARIAPLRHLRFLLSVDPVDPTVLSMDPQKRRGEIFNALRRQTLRAAEIHPQVIEGSFPKYYNGEVLCVCPLLARSLRRRILNHCSNWFIHEQWVVWSGTGSGDAIATTSGPLGHHRCSGCRRPGASWPSERESPGRGVPGRG